MSITDLRNARSSPDRPPSGGGFASDFKSLYRVLSDGIWALAACSAIALVSSFAGSVEEDRAVDIQGPPDSIGKAEPSGSIGEGSAEGLAAGYDEDAELEAASPFAAPEGEPLAYVEIESETAPELSAEQPAEPAEAPWQVYRIKRHDTLGKILRTIKADEEATRYLVSQKFSVYRRLRRNQPIEFRMTEDGMLESLRYKASADLILEFERNSGHDMAAIERAPDLTPRIAAKRGNVTSQLNSLFAATDHENVPDAIVHSAIGALETRVDFARSTRVGDSFVLVYEELLDEDGAFATAGRLLGFSWTNRGEEIIGLYYPEENAFFDPDGHSTQRAFLRSPLKFSRISSKYTNRRYHPVLKKWRAHRGVDFAAPRGTPVRASGDGVITFRGRNGGYGNTVMIKHFGKYTTLYAHLSKFSRAKKGQRVSQGDVIGYVGTTGLSTGPHLHYEFRIGGKHQDPLSAKVPVKRPPLTGEQLAKFRQASTSVLSEIRAIQRGSAELQAAAS